MIKLKVGLKFVSFTLWIVLFFVLTIPFLPLTWWAPNFIRPYLIFVVSFCSQGLLDVLNIKVNSDKVIEKKTYLIVSNHLSYTDILIISSLHPCAFVTSLEMKRAPFLGQLITLAGCLFVNRKDKSKIHQEIHKLRLALVSGISVVFFPEATSTDGGEVLRFKRPLFESSVATQVPILPLTINYHKISGDDFNLKNRDLVCWYGDMSFFPHFMNLLKQKSIEVDLTVHAAFTPGLMTSLEMAEYTHTIVKGAFRPVLTCEGT